MLLLQASRLTNREPGATLSAGHLHAWKFFFLPGPVFAQLLCNLEEARPRAGENSEESCGQAGASRPQLSLFGPLVWLR